MQYGEWTQITDEIYVGSVRAAHDENFLREHDIRGMLSLHPTLGPIPGVVQRNVFLDDGAGNSPRLLVEAVRALHELLSSEDSRPVFVHCQAGVSRSPSIIAALLAVRNGTGIETELEKIREVRGIMPSRGLVSDLKDVQRDIRRAVLQSQSPLRRFVKRRRTAVS